VGLNDYEIKPRGVWCSKSIGYNVDLCLKYQPISMLGVVFSIKNVKPTFHSMKDLL